MLSSRIHYNIYKYGLILFGITLPLHPLSNVICIALLLISWLLEGDFKAKFNELKTDRIFILFGLIILVYTFELLQTENLSNGIFSLQKKLALLLIPLICLSRKSVFFELRDFFFKSLSLTVAITLVFCICLAYHRYEIDNNVQHFFYHDLASNIQMQAIYLSLLSIISAIYIQLNIGQQQKPYVFIFGILLLIISIGIFLLSSKTHIGIYVFLSICNAIRFLYKKKIWLISSLVLTTILIAIILFTNNPIADRYNDINTKKVDVFKSQEFSSAVYFDGFSLRLLFLKFGWEIINENKAWLIGVSPGDSQTLLNQKIIENKLYTGKPGTSDNGYLNLNYHNQYMELFVSCGLIGLIVLMGLLLYFVYLSYWYKSWLLFNFVLVFSVCFLTESMFGRQIGVVSFSIVFSLVTIFPKNQSFKLG